MALLPALCIGGGLLVLAAVVMTYRRNATPERLTAIVILAVLASPAWMTADFRHFNAGIFGSNALINAGVLSLLGSMLPRPTPKPTTRRGPGVFFRVTLGVFFLILGVIGGFVPILQGWIFILIGLLVLFPKAKFTKKVMHKAEPKLPRVVKFLRRFGIGEDEDEAVRP
jgi:hypothetical protein